MRTTLLLALLLCSFALLGADCVPPPDSEVVFGDVDDLPSSLNFSVVEGVDPADQTIQITNSGTCALNYTAVPSTTGAAPWLGVLPTSGSVAASGSATLTVGADVMTSTWNLAPGTYTGTVTIAATCQVTGNAAVGSPAEVSVNMTVIQNAAILGVSDDDLEFDVPQLSSATWTSMSSAGAPANRGYHSAAWSGYELFIAGGMTNASQSSSYVTSAGAYNPLTDTWRTIAPLPSAGGNGKAVWHTSVASGASRLVIFGNYASTSSPSPALIYNPTTNTWTTSTAAMTARWGVECVVSDGGLMFVWGGYGSQVSSSPWFSYDPLTDSAQAMSTTGAPTVGGADDCALASSDFIVAVSGQLGVYDLGPGTWSTSALPSGVVPARMKWTGKDIVGQEPSTLRFHNWSRATGQWSSAFTYTNAASSTHNQELAWTGRSIVFFGQGNPTGYGAFDPETGGFTSLGSDLSSGARLDGQSQVWTGEKLLVFGGWTNAASTTLAPGGAILQ